MAIDIKIDPLTKDLDLSGGRVNFTTDQEEIIRQLLESKLALIQGEYFLDLGAGIDWRTLLIRGQTEPIQRAVIDVLVSDPGVASAEAQVTKTGRKAEVRGTATLTSGESVEISTEIG